MALVSSTAAQEGSSLTDDKKYVPSRSAPKKYDYKIQADVAEDFFKRETLGAEKSLREQEEMLMEHQQIGGYESSGRRGLLVYTYTCSLKEDQNDNGASLCDTGGECLGERLCLENKCWGDHGCDTDDFASYIERVMPDYGQTPEDELAEQEEEEGSSDYAGWGAGWQTTPLNYAYAEGYNKDYIGYNDYGSYMPQTAQYMEFNAASKVSAFNENDICGDCLRGGFVYCTQSYALGSAYEIGSDWSTFYPEGKCCVDEFNCPYASDSSYSCSSEYTDPYYQYQICPVNVDSCGLDQVNGTTDGIKLNGKGATAAFAISGLSKGEVCNYRVQADCNSPIFKPDATNTQFNVTFVEFESDGLEMLSEKKSLQLQEVPDPETKFVYYYHSMIEKQQIYDSGAVEFSHIEQYVDRPRKGQYNFEEGEWKAFNNAIQTETGDNGNTEEFWDSGDKCKKRNIYVTATAVENDATMDITFSTTKINSAYYGLSLAAAASVGLMQIIM